MSTFDSRPVLTRRALLGSAAATGLAALVPAPVTARTRTLGYPFTLGVASGDPTSDAVVLWTRLAPRPLDPDGGMPARPVEVYWEIATDPHLRTVVQRGVCAARPELGHSVHVEPRGLGAHREYWYRFRVDGHLSEIGRTRTLPAPGSSPSALRFAVACCQNYQTGYYTAYRSLAAERPDLVLFLGDYIYEYPPRGDRDVRPLLGGEPADLAGYRARYAQYRADPDLRAAHAAAPFGTVWDDHEVKNDYAGLVPQPSSDPDVVAAFGARRAAAYQAFYEHVPMRRPAGATDFSTLRVYQRLRVGELATINLLDTRQYRSDQPCDDGTGHGNLKIDDTCAERDDPARTILGAQQRAWLLDGLARSDTRWNLIAQQMLFAELRMAEEQNPGRLVMEADGWDGYTADRRLILDHLRSRSVSNPVVFSGDIHDHAVADLPADFADPTARVVATEFVAGAISSPSFGTTTGAADHNPHLRFGSERNGYLSVRLTPERMETEVRSMYPPEGVRYVTPDAECRTEARFVVLDGRPGAQPG
ncbi:alkaline phosphatase D family protein [Plantactinospora sp. DSM 117369]